MWKVCLMSLPEPASVVSSQERRWALAVAVVALLVVSAPYLLGFTAQGAEWRFSGMLFGVEDGNSYIAKMLRGAMGDWLFRTPYTDFPQSGVLMFFPYLLLGKLAAPPAMHEQLTALFHLFRLAAGILMFLASYDFIAFFTADVSLRRLGTLLACLGGGLGWLLVLAGRQIFLGTLPLEFYSPESFGFLAIYGIPHLALGRALALWTLLIYLKAFRGGGSWTWRDALTMGLLWLASGLAQPLEPLLVGLVIAAHLAAGWLLWHKKVLSLSKAISWPAWRNMAALVALAGFLPGLFLAYNALAALSDPFLKIFASQNIITSPHPLHYLLAYGLLLPYAAVGAWSVLMQDDWSPALPVIWLLLVPVLVFSPVNLQRRLAEGSWMAWIALAVVTLDRLPRPARRRRAWPLALAFPSTLLLLAGGLTVSIRPAAPLFLPAAQVDVFEYLFKTGAKDDLALAAYAASNALPAWAPLRVAIGHGPESANLAAQTAKVTAVYSERTPDAERRALLRQLEVRFILWGPQERALGGWNPRRDADLLPVFKSGEYELFERSASIP